MQTFLPVPDFEASAAFLDKKRLWSQVREARQILNTLIGESKGWRNHPAVKMWDGYEPALMEYYNAMLKEAKMRGIKTAQTPFTIVDKIEYRV